MTGPTTHYRTCNLCEAMCGLRIDVQGDRIIAIRGDAQDPLSKGHICPKAPALRELHEDPDRLRRPVVREGRQWKEVGWDEALDRAAAGIHQLQERHGRSSVAIYAGNPNVHNTGSMMFGPVFSRLLRTKNRYSATSVDQLPHMLASYLMFGHQLLIGIPDVDRTGYLLVLGANPVVSNGSLLSAPGMRRRLNSIRRRGGRVVVVDPRRSETAKIADEHVFIRPGTDALFLASLVRTILERGWGRRNHVHDHVEGLDSIEALLHPFTPDRVAGRTGIAAETIVELARQFSGAPSAVCYGRIGTATQKFGGLSSWLINVLNIVTGNLDRAGGAMFTQPAVDAIAGRGATSRGSYGRWRSRVRGLPEFGGELPVVALAEEILTPGDEQVRGLVCTAGNPVLSTPNGRQLERAFASLEFMVSIDYYISETSRFADVILPPVSVLERGHYDLAFHLLAARNTAKYSEPVFDPPPDARHDWQIFMGLAARLERLRGTATAKSRLRAVAMERLGPEGLLDIGLRTGPYGNGIRPWRPGLTLGRLRKEVHGVDLGPLRPAMPGRLPKGKAAIDLVPKLFTDDLARLLDDLEQPSTAPEELLLIGRRLLRSNNSWMHNVPKLVAGASQCTLKMSVGDAERLGIQAGALVRVTSRVGSLTVAAEVSDEMMPGVVSLPHGFGHDRDDIRLSVAKDHAGVSINDLTDDLLIDEISGNAALSGVGVRVEPVADAVG